MCRKSSASSSTSRTSTSPTSARKGSASRRSSQPLPQSRTRSATRQARRSSRCRSRAKKCCARCARQKGRDERRSELELLRPESAEAAAAALGNGSVALAGGTELVPLLRDGIVRAEKLVELRDVVPREVEGARIGAGATLAELEVDPTIPQVLREACALAASPQLRSMSTLGGN